MGKILGEFMELSLFSFQEPDRAERLWNRLRGEGETAALFDRFAPIAQESLARAPEPDRLLINLDRWLETLPNRLTYYRLFAESPPLLLPAMRLMAVSQFFADSLIQSHELSDILLDPVLLRRQKNAHAFHREIGRLIAPCREFRQKLDRMRHFKQRELIRIAALDVMGEWDMPKVARALSDFADASLQIALEVCHQELSGQMGMQGEHEFAIIGMGKLGGRELNYSSDVDLIFIRADQPHLTGPREPEVYLSRLGESIVKALSERMARGIVFRVDLRLRPEGRFGPVARGLESARHYYETWAEPWERQAMLKARFVAGDPRVGEAFIRMIQPLVYRPRLMEHDLTEIRHQKSRIEAQAQSRGGWETDVKTGWGGIRDVEFTTQMLQLMYGGAMPRLRTPNTLHALARLEKARLISAEERQMFEQGYCFLRTVEHRLQMMYEHQTHALPSEPGARALFARRMGFEDLESFEAALKHHRSQIREVFERRFLGETDGQGVKDSASRDREEQEWLLKMETEPGQKAWLARLEALGFQEAQEAFRRLSEPMLGSERGIPTLEERQAYETLLPALLEVTARSPSPDLSLRGIEQLAESAPSRVSLYRAWQESPQVLQRLSELALSPGLWRRLLAHQELLDMLFGEEIVEVGAKPAEIYQQQLAQRLANCRGDRTKVANLLAFARREYLRIGARDLWGESNALQTGEDLTALAETLLRAAWGLSAEETEGIPDSPSEVLMIGFGKLGGCELGHASDWDVGFLCSEETGAANGLEKRVERFLKRCQEWHLAGVFREVDLRLRPEGRSGALIHAPTVYQQYYQERAEPWERLAATRIRVLTLESPLRADFEAIVNEFRYGKSLTAPEYEAIKHLKRRMQTERVKPGEREIHLKLGQGTLSDIEFTAQLLMLRHAHTKPSLLEPEPPTHTWHMLASLHRTGCLNKADYESLASAFRFFSHLKNRLTLLLETPSDVLPLEGERLALLAGSLNYTRAQDLIEEYHTRREAVLRAIKEIWE